jgi:hypothetical protein
MANNPEFVMINNFLIDVSIQEDHTYESEVTDYPIESGGSISDNIRPKPITVTMQGIVSNTPLGGILAARQRTETTSAQGSANVMEKAAYFLLKQIWIDREPVTIRTSLNTFENMALTSLTIPKSKDVGSALHFTASFQQIQIVTNKRVQLRVAVPIGRGAKNLGPLPSTTRLIRSILWRQGNPPGTDFIPFTEVIYLANRETRVPPVGGPQFNTHYDLIYVHANEPVRAGTDSPGSAGYTPLTQQELHNLALDQARDALNKRAGRPLDADGARPSGQTVFDSNGNLRSIPTKAPTTNLSKQARKGSTTDYNDIGKGNTTDYNDIGKGNTVDYNDIGFGGGNFPGR